MQTLVAVSLLDGVDTNKLSSDDWYFLYQIDRGWNKKVIRITSNKPELEAIYRERLKEEVNVILKMKFPSYFLIVQDMLLWCDTAGIRRGPGRGSAAGSLVAYVLDIVKVDPIKYGLLFSRFLNKDRISMPDIDNDIESDKRDEVKKYLVKRYGQEYAASIGTFGTMQVKGAIKDIIRSLNIGGNRAEAFMLADKLNVYVPDGDDVTFDSVCRQQPEFRSLVWYPSKDELAEGWTQRIANGEVPSKHWEVGYHLRKMEGMIRQSGTHAAGVVVSPISLSGIIPMAIDKSNVVTTAIDGTTIDALGFLKIDVLSLKTLSIIEATLRNIKKTRGTDLKAIASQGVGIVENETDTQLEERIKDEPEHIQQASRAFKLLREGRTLGIFQCEAPVAQNLLKAIQANDIEDIAVVNALNRPGPLKAGLVGEFGDRKFGRIKWELPHPSTAKTLAPTFGVLCIAKGQSIYCPDLGIEKPIESIVVGNPIQTTEGRCSTVSAFIPNGVKQVYKFTLTAGYAITATKDHKVLTLEGEKSLFEAYQRRLCIALPKTLNVIQTRSTSDIEKAKLRILGLLISEGSLSSATSVHFTNSCQSLIDDFHTNLALAYPRCKTTRYPGRTLNTYTFTVTKDESQYSNSTERLNYIPNDLLSDLRQWNLKTTDCDSSTLGGCNSYTKFVPDFVFGLDRESKMIFLGALWDGDGCSIPDQCAMFYTTMSSKLARHVWLLLRQLGQLATFVQRKDGAFRVGAPLAFASELMDYCKNPDRIKPTHMAREMISVMNKNLIKNRIKAKGFSLCKIAKLANISLSNLTRRTMRENPLATCIVEKIAVVIQDHDLLDKLANYYWLPIEQMDELGEVQVFDLTVANPNTPWFIGGDGGILLHNCYQEQAMQLAVDCAGFSMSGADSLRKACGKKLPQEMEKLKKQFIDGCYKNHTGFDSMVEYETFEEDKDGNPIRVKKQGTIAERLWNDIAFFASYAFNKSHAVCYAFVAYYTAFLKANYPAEFWAAQLSYESDQVKINRMIIEAKASGLKALPVSINTSEQQYVAESPTSIRRSLGTLKQVGKSAIEELVQHRPYTKIADFIIRCNSRKVNSKRMVALIAAGAFDEFGITRKTLTNKYPVCKKALDRFLVRRIDYYIKDAGARKNCLAKPTELDLELLANMDPTLNKEHNLKFIRIKQLAQTAQAHYLSIKDTVVQDDYESLAAAHTGAIKAILELWEQKASEILVENEWTFDFIENEDDKTEWGLEELITNEKAVYGTAVSAHIFDNHAGIEAKVMEKFPTNFYTLDSDYTQLGNQFELVMMIEVTGLDRQFPYKKDPTKFTRLYRVEDRFGAGEVTVFDKSYDEFLPDDRGIQVRVWKPGNIIVVKVKTNFFNGRKSLVFDKCFKLVYTRQS